MYRALFRHLLRRLDAERAHGLAFGVIRLLGLPGIRAVAARILRAPEAAEVDALGRRFPSAFGLAAGFDKDGRGVLGLGALGFGHVEVGTVTALPQPGNPRPRLARLVVDRALVNRMGFNNRGAADVRRRLDRVRRRRNPPVIGVNIGKSRAVPLEDAIGDYRESTRLLAPVADYLVVNVSSPNTPGLRGLQEIDQLAPLLTAVRDDAGGVPVLVKIAPDVTDDQAIRIAELVAGLGLAGIVATNSTVRRDGLVSPPEVIAAAGEGGLSGPPLAARSLELLGVLRTVLPAAACVISVGGVETAEDARRRLRAGATLVQGYTAFVYEGPLWARRITHGIVN